MRPLLLILFSHEKFDVQLCQSNLHNKKILLPTHPDTSIDEILMSLARDIINKVNIEHDHLLEFLL